MDIKDLKQIIDLMKRSELTELEIEETDLKLRLRREISGPAGSYAERGRTHLPFELADVAAPLPNPVSHPSPVIPTTEPTDASVTFVKSPMVGTFYRAPSPDSSPFVNIGSAINSETVVCIVEAMKVLNEIHAEISGTIVEVLVENGQAVEYGQPLFKVKQG